MPSTTNNCIWPCFEFLPTGNLRTAEQHRELQVVLVMGLLHVSPEQLSGEAVQWVAALERLTDTADVLPTETQACGK